MITLIRWRPAWCLDFPLTFPLSPAKISPSSPMIPIVSITFSQAGYFHFIISLSLSASTLNQMFLSIQGGAWHVADALLVLSLGQVVLPLVFRPLSWLYHLFVQHSRPPALLYGRPFSLPDREDWGRRKAFWQKEKQECPTSATGMRNSPRIIAKNTFQK